MSLFQGEAPKPVELKSSTDQSAPTYLTNYLTNLASVGTNLLGTPSGTGANATFTPKTGADLITPLGTLSKAAYEGDVAQGVADPRKGLFGYEDYFSDASGSLTDAGTAYTNAQTAFSNAATPFTNAATSFTNAATPLTSAGTAFTNAGNAYTNAQTAFTGSETPFTQALNAYTDADTAFQSAYDPFKDAGSSFTNAVAMLENVPISKSDISGFYNPYETDVINKLAEQQQANINRNLLPSLRAGFAGQGALGSSRYANVLGQSLADANQNLLAQQAKMRQAGYETALEAALKQAGYEVQAGQGLTQAGLGQVQRGKGFTDLGLGQAQRGRGLTDLGQGYLQRGQGLTQLGLGQTQTGLGEIQRARGYTDVGQAQTQLGLGQTQLGQGLTQMGLGETQTGAAQTQLAKSQQEAAEEAYKTLAGLGTQQMAYDQSKLEAPLTRAANVAQLLRGYSYPTSASAKTETFPPMYNKSPLEQIAGLGSLIGAAYPQGGGGFGPKLESWVERAFKWLGGDRSGQNPFEEDVTYT